MRICFFSPDERIIDLHRDILLKDLGKIVSNDEPDEIYFVTYRWPNRQGFIKNHYLLSERETFGMKVCCKLFKIIDQNRWIPTFSAIFSLLLGKKQILGTLLGCDPDVVIPFDLRWDRQLKWFLKKYYPAWVCLTKRDREFNVIQNWRKYDKSAKISIVLPTYNGSKYIRTSIESCLKQTHKNIELIIVDDGSRESIKEIVDSYNDSRVRYLRHESNLGLPRALNTGFQNSVGEYLTWTSDDNHYTPNAIEEMVSFLQTYPEAGFVYAECYIIDENDRIQRIQRNKTPYYLRFDNFIGGCFLYKRKVYETVGKYNFKVLLVEDYDYWLRVSKRFKMQPVFKQLYFYRFHKDSLTSKYGRENVLEKVKLAKEINKANHLPNIGKYILYRE